MSSREREHQLQATAVTHYSENRLYKHYGTHNVEEAYKHELKYNGEISFQRAGNDRNMKANGGKRVENRPRSLHPMLHN